MKHFSAVLAGLIALSSPAFAESQSGGEGTGDAAADDADLTWCSCFVSDTERHKNLGKGFGIGYYLRNWYARPFQVSDVDCGTRGLWVEFRDHLSSQVSLRSDANGYCFDGRSRRDVLGKIDQASQPDPQVNDSRVSYETVDFTPLPE